MVRLLEKSAANDGVNRTLNVHFAPTANVAPGSLAGTYAGATASATVGVGLGANVLVGGSGNSIALQPVSIQGTTGLNVAAGIAAMTLTFQPG